MAAVPNELLPRLSLPFLPKSVQSATKSTKKVNAVIDFFNHKRQPRKRLKSLKHSRLFERLKVARAFTPTFIRLFARRAGSGEGRFQNFALNTWRMADQKGDRNELERAPRNESACERPTGGLVGATREELALRFIVLGTTKH